jgi:O-methyltransferase domain/Dimerisation domain
MVQAVSASMHELTNLSGVTLISRPMIFTCVPCCMRVGEMAVALPLKVVARSTYLTSEDIYSMKEMSDVETLSALEDDAAALNGKRMLQMIFGYSVTQIVHAVAHFGIAEELAKGAATAAEVATRCATDPDATFRLLRACASLGLVVADGQLRFARTPLLDTLRRDVPGSLRGVAIAQASPGHWLPWGRFNHAVKTGSPQAAAALGREVWEYYKDNPEESAAFSAAMSGMTAMVSKAVVAIVDTRSIEVAADIGGSGGALLHALMEANPRLQGILFDLPEVVATASLASRWQGMRERFSVAGGDFLSSVPPADLYLLKYILHDWDSNSCVRILGNCRRSLRSGGRVVVIEQQVGEMNQPGPDPLIDLIMLVMTSGGRERTLSEYEDLYSAAGLRVVSVTPIRSGMVVMESVAK